jgi:stage II sporulation protein D
MSLLAKKSILGIIISLLFISTTILTGCQQIGLKPKISEEVKKYNNEPVISLYRSAKGTKEEIKLEEYLKGVLAAEMSTKFPLEALKAQAIVARTMTLTLIEYENGTRAKHGTDASDNHLEFQEYKEEEITDKISKAVDETRGQVLTYNGKFAYTMFHALSQNKTASMAEGFPNLAKRASYLVPVSTDGMKFAPEKYRNWTVKIPRWQIRKIMGSKAGNLDDIRVSKHGPSGRAIEVKAGKSTITAVDLRKEIGPDKLYSTIWNSVKPQGNYIIFQGSGWR